MTVSRVKNPRVWPVQELNIPRLGSTQRNPRALPSVAFRISSFTNPPVPILIPIRGLALQLCYASASVALSCRDNLFNLACWYHHDPEVADNVNPPRIDQPIRPALVPIEHRSKLSYRVDRFDCWILKFCWTTLAHTILCAELRCQPQLF